MIATRSALALLGCLAIASSALGCSGLLHCEAAVEKAEGPKIDYVLVEYRAGGLLNTAPKVEVSETPTYHDRRTSLTKAAIRFPETCLTKTAGAAAGTTQNSEAVLTTTCGVYLAELERALAGAGFQVYSWDALRQLEAQKKVSTYVAAKELGADVVFVFNSLEAGEILAGSATGTSYKYYGSDAAGQKGEPLALEDKQRAVFRGFAADRMKASKNEANAIIGIGSTLDTTAILTDTGESIWFYRRTVTKPVKANAGKRFLFAGIAGHFAPTRPVGLQTDEETAKASAKTEDVDTQVASATAIDPYAAVKLELERAAAADFVGRFRGALGAAPAPQGAK